MHEIEIKLQVPPAQADAVDAAVAGRARAPRQRLQAAYFDTPDRLLAGAGLALRLRREGRRWVQTLKGATGDALVRHEHEAGRGSAAATPPLDPALHAGTPVGDALHARLARHAGEPLAERYRTDVQRRTRVLNRRADRDAGVAAARVELAFDRGRIESADARLAICELEIELVAGAPQAVVDCARDWTRRFGLWLDTRSKAERGDLLARGESIAPARRAAAVRLDPAMSAAAAWRAVLASCTDQIVANASQIASGEHGPEHVHQLRIGLRRLRSALQLFEPTGATAAVDAALGGAAAQLFRRLGAARDSVVIEAEFGAGLRAALQRADVAAALPAGADDGPAAPHPAAGAAPAVDPAALLREAASQTLLLDLVAALQADAAAPPAPPPDAAPLPAQLAKTLNRWHRQVAAAAKRFDTLDDAARHRLRKRAKRLRYGVEFAAALFDRRAVRRYLRALRALQEQLGAVTDATMAIAAYAQDADADPRRWFAVGWLAAQRERLVETAAPALRAFGKVGRFWK